MPPMLSMENGRRKKTHHCGSTITDLPSKVVCGSWQKIGSAISQLWHSHFTELFFPPYSFASGYQ